MKIEEAIEAFQESEEDWSIYKDHEKREMAFLAGASWARGKEEKGLAALTKLLDRVSVIEIGE